MSVNSYVCESTVLPKDKDSVGDFLNNSCKQIKDADIKSNTHLLHLPVTDGKQSSNVYVCRGQFSFDKGSVNGCQKQATPSSCDQKFDNISFQISSINDALNLHTGASLPENSISSKLENTMKGIIQTAQGALEKIPSYSYAKQKEEAELAKLSASERKKKEEELAKGPKLGQVTEMSAGTGYDTKTCVGKIREYDNIENKNMCMNYCTNELDCNYAVYKNKKCFLHVCDTNAKEIEVKGENHFYKAGEDRKKMITSDVLYNTNENVCKKINKSWTKIKSNGKCLSHNSKGQVKWVNCDQKGFDNSWYLKCNENNNSFTLKTNKGKRIVITSEEFEVPKQLTFESYSIPDTKVEKGNFLKPNSWWIKHFNKSKKTFQKNNIDINLFGVKNSEWTYNGVPLCVGSGSAGNKCDNKKMVCAGGSKFGSGSRQRNAVIAAVNHVRAHGTQHMSCPKYRGTGRWWENYLRKNRKKFEAHGLRHELFGKKGNQWTYKGSELCVGIGTHNKKCDNKNLFCAGKTKNGGGIHQINAIIKAAKNLTDNGRPHPSCPVSDYGTETIKSDRPVLGLGTDGVVTFQFRRDGRLQMFKQNGSKENLFCVEQVIEKKCRTSAYHNAILCNNGEFCDSSGKNGFKCCDTKGGINKCPKGYNMCNNGKCNRSVEGFTVREHFRYNFGRGVGRGKYCKPFPGNAACKSRNRKDRCYPVSSLNACKASCGKGCYGISYDSSRKWCVKCKNFKSMGTYGSWNSYKRGGIVQCNVGKTKWIGSKMVKNNWSQGQGERAQKCKVPSKYRKHIPKICSVGKTKWINSKMQKNKWSQGKGERAQKCKVPQKYRKYIKKVNNSRKRATEAAKKAARAAAAASKRSRALSKKCLLIIRIKELN